MPRLPLPVLAIAIAALLAVVPAAVTPAASPETGTIVRVELELQASHGLQAKLETSDDEEVTLELGREGRLVSYEVAGEVTQAGLKVRFGRLGLIDVAFTPTKTLSMTEPSEGCTGEPRTLQEGIFTGTIDFTGERNYVRIEGPQAEGSMSVISQWQCPEEPTLFAGERESASLHASSRRCSCSFSAGVHHSNSGGGSVFYGAKAERREGMGIVRVTFTYAGVSAFAFDHAAGTATVHPPRPFRGHATLRPRPHGRDLWRSTIRVPLLGVDPLRTSAPGFRAGLYPEYHFD